MLAGKAHPRHEQAKGAVPELFELARHAGPQARIVFLGNHDLAMGRVLATGCDVWVNLPRPPLEASGTSGMKAALSGGLNLSVLDGWWAEGYDGGNGWAISGEVDDDHGAQDAGHAAAFFDILENQVLPLFWAPVSASPSWSTPPRPGPGPGTATFPATPSGPTECSARSPPSS